MTRVLPEIEPRAGDPPHPQAGPAPLEPDSGAPRQPGLFNARSLCFRADIPGARALLARAVREGFVTPVGHSADGVPLFTREDGFKFLRAIEDALDAWWAEVTA